MYNPPVYARSVYSLMREVDPRVFQEIAFVNRQALVGWLGAERMSGGSPMYEILGSLAGGTPGNH